MSEKLNSSQILFIGAGRSAVCWYRCATPAMFLGCDWAGFDDDLNLGAGLVRGGTQYPNLMNDYKIVVYQQPRSARAMQLVRDLQSNGVKVIIDCDDYLHGVRKSKDHDFRNAKPFKVKELAKFERIMGVADGLILSTPWLAEKYRSFNERVWVCRNGLDLGRYDKSRAPHPGVNIGWAGATGHMISFGAVLKALDRIMAEFPYVNFVSIGQNFADQLGHHGPNRVVSVPWTSMELYPNAMTMFDIALAPARESHWYRAKSQLRYYEAAAVGAVTLGTGWLYDEIVDDMTGYKIVDGTSDEWYERMKLLVTDHQKRAKMQAISRALAFEEFDMHNRRNQWAQVFEEVAQELA